MKLEVAPDPGAAALRAAEIVAEHARAAVAARGEFHLAASGGTTPWRMFAALSAMDLPWERVHVWQVDERVAPEGHPDRNLTGLAAALTAPANLHPIPVTHPDTYQAARSYAAQLPSPLDLVHLGLGNDGHTASLVPGDPAVDEEEALVAVTLPYKGRRRVTLTFLPINRARARLWLVCGADKREVVRAMLAQDTEVVAGRVTHDDTCCVIDGAAAGD
ncbi:MAG: 6-phosphogluconolactonase [Myxococcota bacterium]